MPRNQSLGLALGEGSPVWGHAQDSGACVLILDALLTSGVTLDRLLNLFVSQFPQAKNVGRGLVSPSWLWED